MKIEINTPHPEEQEPQVDQSKRQFLKGIGYFSLSLALGGIIGKIMPKEQKSIPQKPKSVNDKETPEPKKPELFQGDGNELFQQALDHPKEFLAQQGLASEYQDSKNKKDLEQLIQNQILKIWDDHHRNLDELNDLFLYVQNAAPIILKEAKEQGIPLAIALGLAMKESNCNPQVRNPKSSATGLFQLIETTAKSHGLKVDKKNDERKNPVKNTRAALTYLKQLHDFFGRWDLSLLAYNEGRSHLILYLASIQEKPNHPLLEKVDKQNLEKQNITYLRLHQDYNEQSRYPLNVEANIRLYLWYIYEKASREKNILPQKQSPTF